MADLLKWNGSAWVGGDCFKNTNGNWNEKATIFKNVNGNWVQIYPDLAADTSQYVDNGPMKRHLPDSNQWLFQNASEGDGTPWGGSRNTTGYLGVTNEDFNYYGSVISVSSAKLYVKRARGGYTGSGMDFHIKSINNVTSTPYAGYTFGTVYNGGGEGTVTHGFLDTNNVKNWMNDPGSKYLAINNGNGKYGCISNITFDISYSYRVNRAIFMKQPNIMNLAVMNNAIPKTEIYHEMLIYPDELNMTLPEIVQHRTENNIPDIKASNEIEKPYILNFKIEGESFILDLFNLKEMESEFYFKLEDGIKRKFIWIKGDTYKGILPANYKGNLYIRIENTRNNNIILKENKIVF